MSKKHWHPAFWGATEWEFKQNKNDLTYEPEHELSKEPLRMDMLIIKKNPAAQIRNEIGRIFRTHNIVEFKGLGDSLNIDDYHKIIGYACLYKSLGKHVNEIPADEITVTIMRQSYPREMIKHLINDGIQISEKYPGIFYLTGNVMFDTQIIVTRQLSDEHAALRILTDNAQEADVRRFLEEARQTSDRGDRQNIDAVLQVSAIANPEVYENVRRNENMCQALRELMKDEIDKEVEDAATNTRLSVLKELMKNLALTAEQAMNAMGISDADQPKYLAMLK